MASGEAGIQAQLNGLAIEHRQDTTAQLPQLQRIVLCTDFSLASETATAIAIDLCKRTGATLCVLHICEYGIYQAPTESELAYVTRGLERENENLRNVVNRIQNEGISVSASIATGHPPVSIVEFIASRKPDLAIVGTNGISGLERMIFGSTAEAVFRHACCPVLIVGPKVSSDRQNSRGPVVFATDFHDPAKQAAKYAFALAHLRSSPLHCLHVLPMSVANEGEHAILASIMKEALRQLTEKAQGCHAKVSYQVMYDTEISHAVVSYAEKHRAGLIVLGVRRGPILCSHLPPHLTYRMIATAPCPVLTVSPEVARLASQEPDAATKTEGKTN